MGKKRRPVCQCNLIAHIGVECFCLAIERGFQRNEVGRIGVPYAKVMRVQTSGKLDVKVVDVLMNHYVCVLQEFSVLGFSMRYLRSNWFTVLPYFC